MVRVNEAMDLAEAISQAATMTPQEHAAIKVTQADINLWDWCKTALRESRNWREDDPATNEHLFQLDTTAQKLLAAHRLGIR